MVSNPSSILIFVGTNNQIQLRRRNFPNKRALRIRSKHPKPTYTWLPLFSRTALMNSRLISSALDLFWSSKIAATHFLVQNTCLTSVTSLSRYISITLPPSHQHADSEAYYPRLNSQRHTGAISGLISLWRTPARDCLSRTKPRGKNQQSVGSRRLFLEDGGCKGGHEECLQVTSLTPGLNLAKRRRQRRRQMRGWQ